MITIGIIVIASILGWYGNYKVIEFTSRNSSPDATAGPMMLFAFIPWLFVVLWLFSFVLDRIYKWLDLGE